MGIVQKLFKKKNKYAAMSTAGLRHLLHTKVRARSGCLCILAQDYKYGRTVCEDYRHDADKLLAEINEITDELERRNAICA